MAGYGVAEVPVFCANGSVNSKEAWVQDQDVGAFPLSYRENTQKEQLIVEYVANFRDQFEQLFPDRRPLPFFAFNEGGVSKFLCTSLRPTQLPLRELYTAKNMARFVARHCRYEPLEEPTRPPGRVLSPTSVLARRAGDCFDLAMLLTSLLIGAGHDAYCVFGTAPAWVTLRDLSHLRCDYEVPSLQVQEAGYKRTLPTRGAAASGNAASRVQGKYSPPALPSLEIEFDARMQARAAQEEVERAAADDYESDDDPDAEGSWLARGQHSGGSGIVPVPNEVRDGVADPLEGSRVHCWVLIRPGNREVTEPTLIEPSTGRLYSAKEAPYLLAEAVWNNQNYWVNMQHQELVPDPDEPFGATPAAPAAAGAASAADLASDTATDDGDQIASARAAVLQVLAAPTLSAAADAAGKAQPTRAEEAAAAALGQPLGGGSSTSAGTPGAEGKEEEGGAASAVPGASGGRAPASAEAKEPEAAAGEAAARADNGGEEEGEGEEEEDAEEAAFAGSGPLARLSWDFSMQDDWENVLIPPDTGAAERRQRRERAAARAAEEAAEAAEAVAGGAAAAGLMSPTPGGVGTPVVEVPGGADEDEGFEADGEHVLDLPPTWCRPIRIARSALQGGGLGPGGSLVEHFYKCKLQEFAPRSHPRGLVARLVEFADRARLQPRRVTEVFSHRSDKLCQRVSRPGDGWMEQLFEPDRPAGDGVRRIVDILGERRTVDYYTSARIDSMLKREEVFGRKISEWYDEEATRDRLAYRSVTFGPRLDVGDDPSATGISGAAGGAAGATGGAGSGPALGGGASTAAADILSAPAMRQLEAAGGVFSITKMAEKFARNPDMPAHRDIAKLSFVVADMEIEARYHVAEGRIVASCRRYTVDDEGGSGMEFVTEDPFAPTPGRSEVETDFRAAVAQQRACHESLRDKHKRCTTGLVEARGLDEANLRVEMNVFELAEHKAAQGLPVDDGDHGEEEEDDDEELDYLAPFVHDIEDPENMDLAEAKRVRQRATTHIMKRQAERVNIIQRRRMEEEDKLQRLKRELGQLRTDAGDSSAEAEYKRRVKEAMFRIGILKRREARQSKLYVQAANELGSKLRADPRLAVLFDGSPPAAVGIAGGGGGF